LPAGRLDLRHRFRFLRTGGILVQGAARGGGVQRHHADAMGHHIMQIVGDPGAFVCGRQPGFVLTFPLQLLGSALQLTEQRAMGLLAVTQYPGHQESEHVEQQERGVDLERDEPRTTTTSPSATSAWRRGQPMATVNSATYIAKSLVGSSITRSSTIMAVTTTSTARG